ncbi:hypothetical protein, partial [Streptomyces sp. SID339]|uniref:hypothetical protein n=1 Tax=Streptomyces sp. SID339 TaxID=2706080 RepID=UPI0013D9BC41
VVLGGVGLVGRCLLGGGRLLGELGGHLVLGGLRLRGRCGSTTGRTTARTPLRRILLGNRLSLRGSLLDGGL